MKSLDLSLMDTKLYKKFAKIVGDQHAKELLEKSDADLDELIAAHTVTIARATEETKAVPAYVAATNVKKEFEAALKEKNKPLQLAVQLAAMVRNSRK